MHANAKSTPGAYDGSQRNRQGLSTKPDEWGLPYWWQDGSEVCETTTFNKESNILVFLRRPRGLFILIQSVVDSNMDGTECKIRICGMIATSSKLAATYDIEAYW